MRTTATLIVAVAIGSLAGCSQPDRPPPSPRLGFKSAFVAEEEPVNVTSRHITGNDDPANAHSVATDLSPSPELARAVRRGEARPAGPITDERYRRWYATADLRVRLEVQLGQQSRLRDLLKMSEESEERFLRRFGSGGVGPGESADLQLRMYQAVRQRLQKHLIATDLEITNLREKIARTAGAEAPPTRLRDIAMPEKPLAQCGFNAAQIAKLEGLGIRTARDFALQFYLPEQHESASALLGVDLAEAQRLIRETAKEVPEGELAELVREARRPHEFGVLPPDLEQKERPQ